MDGHEYEGSYYDNFTQFLCVHGNPCQPITMMRLCISIEFYIWFRRCHEILWLKLMLITIAMHKTIVPLVENSPTIQCIKRNIVLDRAIAEPNTDRSCKELPFAVFGSHFDSLTYC